MQTVANAVLDFWFGEPLVDGSFEPKPYWFKSTPELDAEITSAFGDSYETAVRGGFDSLIATSEDFLAMVIILDQFPRNMFRGTPKAFAADNLALKWAQKAVAGNFDKEQPAPHRRMFFYLPYEHSENLTDQDDCIRLMETIGNDEYLRYAHLHRDVIRKFGRFPHRNKILGRTSTPEEEEYLRQPGAGF